MKKSIFSIPLVIVIIAIICCGCEAGNSSDFVIEQVVQGKAPIQEIVPILKSYKGNDVFINLPTKDEYNKPVQIVQGNFNGVTEIQVPESYIYVEISSDTLEAITISNGVEQLRLSCPALKSIVIPSSCLDESGMARFSLEGCASLANVTFPEGIKGIPKSAFAGSAIETITLPDNLLSIGSYAFAECKSLVSVTMGDNTFSQSVIGIGAFKNCTSLKNVALGTTYATGESKLVSRLDRQNQGISPFDRSINIIEREAFMGCSALENVTISEGWELINMNAFQDCISIKEVVMPSSMVTIGFNAFENCTSLETIILNDGIEQLLGGAFFNCVNLTNCNFPESLLCIEYSTFEGTQITVPAGNYNGVIFDYGSSETDSESVYSEDAMPSDIENDKKSFLGENLVHIISQNLYEYYISYLTSINLQDSGHLSYVTPTHAEFLEKKIFGYYKDYEVSFNIVIVDLDTVEVYNNANQNRMRFYALFMNGISNRTSNGENDVERNIQIVNMVFDETTQTWLVDSTEIANNITIGANQLVLNGW